MITAEEEVELMGRIRKGDQPALEKLVTANLRFVVSVAKQFQNQGLSFPDLINEGNVGLVRAAGKFDETRGFKFISYAVWWIRQAIIQAITEQTRIVRLPLNQVSSINKIIRAIPYLEQSLEREPTDSEIAEYLDLSDDHVENANRIRKRQISFDMPISREGESDLSLYDVIASENHPAPDHFLIDESLALNIARALKKLPGRESEVLVMSFGLFGNPVLTQTDIAEHFGMTPERIRQIRHNGLEHLKKLLSGSKSLFAI